MNELNQFVTNVVPASELFIVQYGIDQYTVRSETIFCYENCPIVECEELGLLVVCLGALPTSIVIHPHVAVSHV